jgi:hypothetical protein
MDKLDSVLDTSIYFMVDDCKEVETKMGLTTPKKTMERKMFRDILAILALDFAYLPMTRMDYSFGEEIGLPDGTVIQVSFSTHKAVQCDPEAS